jgi:diguanylate cyclase (GGDEF)-like protein
MGVHREAAARPWSLLAATSAVMACLAMLVTRLLPDASAMWDIAWTAASVSALAGVVLARRSADGPCRAHWAWWAAAAMCWLAGQLAWDLFGIIGSPQSPNVADAGWSGFALLAMIGVVRAPGASRSVRVVALVEALPLVAAAVALTFSQLWPAASASSLPLAPRISALVYPAVYVSAAVLTLQALIGGTLATLRRSAPGLVLCGLVAQALAFSLWSVQLLDQTYQPGRSPLDPLWVFGLLAIAAGGFLASRRPTPPMLAEEPSRWGGVLPAVTFGLLVAALVRARLHHYPAGATTTLQAGLLFSGLALIVRGGLLESRLRSLLGRERAARAHLAERESELARLNERLVEDSRRDPLTGMRNRRALSEDLVEFEASGRERPQSFAFALCDVDRFKAYNDSMGHLAGDQALRAVAATVRGVLRDGDAAYRFGGEELLLVLRDTGEQEALAVVERVRAAVEAAALTHPQGIGRRLTVSIGVAAGADEPSALLERADAALYDAKSGGRNRVVLGRAAGGHAERKRAREPFSDEPLPRHLQAMLTISRASSRGGAIGVLEALAEAIRSELSFQVVAVNLLDERREQLEVVVVLGDPEAREALLGTANPWSEWEDVLTSGHDRCGAIWLPEGSHDWSDDTTVWTPVMSAPFGPDSWHPLDMLLLPLRSAAGEILAVVSVDQPLTGRRPSDADLRVLMAVADHAGLALEAAQRDSGLRSPALDQPWELRLAAVMLLAETLDLRDQGTGRHSRTVGDYARATAVELGLPPERVETIYAAGVLHDLGKLGIPDAILHKAGPLDEREWREIKRHPEIGARILEHAGMGELAHWVRTHHERIDGRGYPDGLEPAEVPIEARILSVADAYEAMTADRPYRRGMPADEARSELLRCAGTQFDRDVVEAFLRALHGQSDLNEDDVQEAA